MSKSLLFDFITNLTDPSPQINGAIYHPHVFRGTLGNILNCFSVYQSDFTQIDIHAPCEPRASSMECSNSGMTSSLSLPLSRSVTDGSLGCSALTILYCGCTLGLNSRRRSWCGRCHHRRASRKRRKNCAKRSM